MTSPQQKLFGEIRRRVAHQLSFDSNGSPIGFTWVDAADRLEVVMRQLLADAHPPWWRIDLRLMRSKDHAYILDCIRYGWPDWFWLAIRQGVNEDQLTAAALLVGHEIPRRQRRPYLGG